MNDKHQVIFPIGISGSGKNYLYKTRYSDHVLIEPDMIRKIRTGSITDQSRNAEVFDLCHHFLKREMSYGQHDIYLSETHLWLPGIKDELEMVLAYGYEPVFVILVESLNWRLCSQRVKDAISRGEDRSATASIIMDDGTPLIEAMYEGFKELVGSEEFKELVRPYKVYHV